MKLSTLGEDAVVAALVRDLPLGTDVRHGAGDDCAVIGGRRDRWWRLLKTDCVVESVHFLPGEKAARVGWKALCRAISDIAAMGGIPEHAVVTLAVRPGVAMSWLRGLYAGLNKAARKFGVSIVGGETSRSPGPAFISVALTGRVERARCVTRSGGKAGDLLYVTGCLGGSRSGRHLDFVPRVAEARWLVEKFRLCAMMDLSDGLGADLPRLARASRCSFELWQEKIPRSRGCTIAQAIGDGEDFELLFAISPRDAARLDAQWRKAFPKLSLTRIGALTRPDTPVAGGTPALRGVLARSKRTGKRKTLTRGHDHFA